MEGSVRYFMVMKGNVSRTNKRKRKAGKNVVVCSRMWYEED